MTLLGGFSNSGDRGKEGLRVESEIGVELGSRCRSCARTSWIVPLREMVGPFGERGRDQVRGTIS